MNGRYYRGPCPGGIRGFRGGVRGSGVTVHQGVGGGYSGGVNDILSSQTGGGGA